MIEMDRLRIDELELYQERMLPAPAVKTSQLFPSAIGCYWLVWLEKQRTTTNRKSNEKTQHGLHSSFYPIYFLTPKSHRLVFIYQTVWIK